MGRLQCKCGLVLSNVDCPNDVTLWGFEKKSLDACDAANILLTDAVMEYHISNHYYWYCKECGRIYVFKINQQTYQSVYRKCNLQFPIATNDVLQLSEIYFFTDKQVEIPTEVDFTYTLQQFLENPPHPYRFFVAPDQRIVYAYHTSKKKVVHLYQLEETYNDRTL